jgi:hypothetical protein
MANLSTLLAYTFSSSAEFFVIGLSDDNGTFTAGTAKATFRAPFAMTLYEIPRITLTTAATTNTVTVDINVANTSILGTNKLTIDAGELTSVTALTPTTLVTTDITDDQVFTFDIDLADTTAAGLKIIMYYRKL